MNQALAIDKTELPAVAPASQLTPMQMAYQLISNGADLGSVKEMLAMSRELAAEQARQADVLCSLVNAKGGDK